MTVRSLIKNVIHKAGFSVIRLPRESSRFDLLAPHHQRFAADLINHTENFGHCYWLGQPIWQNVFDAWITQEVISEIRPDTIIECGTNRGGSSYFYASLCDLIGNGQVITIDVEDMHPVQHPRITFLLGSSIDPRVIETVTKKAQGTVLIILDSNHDEDHVFAEMEAFAPLVTNGSYMFVQDGLVDVIGTPLKGRPGPLVAIERFLRLHPEFALDQVRSSKLLITHSPKGWLRRL